MATNTKVVSGPTNITASGGAVTILPRFTRNGAVGILVTGTWSATLTFELTLDSATWTAVKVIPYSTGTAASTTTSNDSFYVQCFGGVQGVRARCSAYTSGTAVVTLSALEG